MQLTPVKLFVIQLIAHIVTVYWLFNASTADFIIALIVYFFTGCIGMTITYHRLLTHRSFKAPKWFEIFGTLCGTLGLTGSSLSWTAAHRLHHSRADRINDPHSPKILGYIRAQYLSMFSEIDIRKSPVIRSKLHQFLHRYYIPVNLLWAILLVSLVGWWWMITVYLVPACILWNAGSLINTVCHTRWLGYRPFNVPDNSVNNPILGLLMWGEGWHNNHHRFQNSPNIGRRWWEIDIGYYIILLIRKKNETKT